MKHNNEEREDKKIPTKKVPKNHQIIAPILEPLTGRAQPRRLSPFTERKAKNHNSILTKKVNHIHYSW